MENSGYVILVSVIIILIVVFIILYFTWYTYWKVRDFEDDWCETRKAIEEMARIAHDCCEDKCPPTPVIVTDKDTKKKKRSFFG